MNFVKTKNMKQSIRKMILSILALSMFLVASTQQITVPIHFHISRAGDTSNQVISTSDTDDMISVLNSAFADMDIDFTKCDISFLDNTDWNIEFNSDNDAELEPHDLPNVLNIYVFDEIAGASAYSAFPRQQTDRIVIKVSRITTSTIAHEMGHYFSLQHTYSTSRGEELVNGSNCVWAGDQVCDTPPDPDVRDDFNANCQYIGSDVDSNGDLYAPDGLNFMGKGDHTCRDRFSPMQKQKIRASAEYHRYHLVNCNGDTPLVGCPVVISQFPHNETFESWEGQSDWIQEHAPKDDANWDWDALETASSSTGPSSAQDGDFYMSIEASRWESWNTIAMLRSPCVDLTGKTSASVEFYYHMYGSDIGALKLELSSNNGSNWSTLWIKNGQQHTSETSEWTKATISLSAFTDQNIQLSLSATQTGSRGDIAIDNITINAADSEETLSTDDSGIADNEKICLFPNPAMDFLKIRSTENVRMVTLYELNGAIHKEIFVNSKEEKIDVSTLRSGIYPVKIVTEEGEYVRRLIKK